MLIAHIIINCILSIYGYKQSGHLLSNQVIGSGQAQLHCK